ncbi:MAG: ComEA family DNA-binding protein [Lachnospiraceae bacterium]|nr:ComEA family DNA-binding protein [Lachnospiraceae bacterium]
MERIRYLAALLLIMFFLLPAAGCGKVPGRRLDLPAAETETQAGTAETDYSGVVVYVCGYVKEPGVYSLPADARAGDAVKAAGGFLSEADTEYINLAETLTDGEQLRVPSRKETAADSAVSAEADDGLVNINTADAETLETLPGVGPAKAEAIIAYREEQGGFTVIEDIMLVPGIKEAAFSRIKDHIKV